MDNKVQFKVVSTDRTGVVRMVAVNQDGQPARLGQAEFKLANPDNRHGFLPNAVYELSLVKEGDDIEQPVTMTSQNIGGDKDAGLS